MKYTGQKHLRKKGNHRAVLQDNPSKFVRQRPEKPLRVLSKVTVSDVEIRDAPYWAVHILHSEAVAVVGVNIQGDPKIPNNGELFLCEG